MKRFALVGLGIALAAICITGCSWETGNDAESWSSSYNWVNFSGTYRGSSGGLLVTDYSTTPSTPGSTNVVTVSSEGQGGFVTGSTDFSGVLNHGNLVAGSATITLRGNNSTTYKTFADNGNGVLGNSEGTIDYVSGAWSISMSILIPVPGPGQAIAAYSYYVSNDGSSGSGAVSGASGISIYSFNVTHSGQNVTIVDNNGATFVGKIDAIRSASGAQNTDIGQVASDETGNDTSLHSKNTYYESPLPEDGDAIIATFECSGTSAAAMAVKIVGTLEGTVASGVFTGRKMNGTWIEVGGKTGDIFGLTGAIPVASVIATTDTTATDTTADAAADTTATQ